MLKRFKVISCMDSMFWYLKYIGTDKDFAIIREESDRYWTRDEDGYLNFVLKKDAKEI